MTDENDKIRVELELPRWAVDALARWKIPADHCGSSIEARIAFLVDDMAVLIEEAERDQQPKAKTPTSPPPRFLH